MNTVCTFKGRCVACDLTFTGADGAQALHAHRKAVHPRQAVAAYRVPSLANGKPTAWRAPSRRVPNPDSAAGRAYADAMVS